MAYLNKLFVVIAPLSFYKILNLFDWLHLDPLLLIVKLDYLNQFSSQFLNVVDIKRSH